MTSKQFFTKTEQMILKLLAKGLTRDMIAQEMGVQCNTIKMNLTRMYYKADLHNNKQIELLRFALRHDMITLEEMLRDY